MSNTGDFDKYFDHYQRIGHATPDWDAAARRPSEYACRKAWLPKNAHAKILDFGCGWGDQLLSLWCAGYRDLEGVELVPEQAEATSNGVGGRFPVHCMDGQELIASRPASYDLIILNDVIEHVSPVDAVPFLSGIYAALRPAGRVVVRTPNMASLLAAYSRYIDLTHKTGYTEFSLVQVTEQAGFVRQRFVSDYNWDPVRWRPWRPLQNLGLQALANRSLHHVFYFFRAQSPKPRLFGYNLELYADRATNG